MKLVPRSTYVAITALAILVALPSSLSAQKLTSPSLDTAKLLTAIQLPKSLPKKLKSWQGTIVIRVDNEGKASTVSVRRQGWDSEKNDRAYDSIFIELVTVAAERISITPATEDGRPTTGVIDFDLGFSRGRRGKPKFTISGYGAMVVSEPKMIVVEKNVEEPPDDFVDDEFIPAGIDPTWDREELARNTQYPELALDNRIEGIVIVSAMIDTNGRVIKTKVLQSPHSLLNDPAVAAVRATRFTPAIVDGRPLRSWVQVDVEFKLP